MRWRKGSKVKLVSAEEADDDTRALYRRVEQTLGVPAIPLFLPALAAFPNFLAVMWQALHPAIETPEFFHAAQRLRADAYTRIYNYFAVPDLCERVTELRFSAGARQ